MSYCSCKRPKLKTMTILFKEVNVCAKSEGGCGLEVATGKAKIFQGARAKIMIDGKVVAEAKDVSYNINPHITNKVTCPRCNGKGTVQKFVGFGLPAKDEICDYCDGDKTV